MRAMNQLIHEELTIADIKVLAASIYEPQARLWTNNQWCCPQCQRMNDRATPHCTCGITRDGLPEFCER